MTPRDLPLLPGPWPDVLAAFVDGELDPAARVFVERWLAAHPGALDALHSQRQLSPANWPLWQQVEPSLPSEQVWNQVREAVHRGIESPPMPVRARNWRLRAGVYFAGGVAAATLSIVLIGMALRKDPQLRLDPGVVLPDDPLADYAVLPMATEADVEIERVAGNSHGLLFGDAPLALASEDDVQLAEAEPHPAWPGGSPKMTTAPGDVPMIFAARPR